VRQDKTQVIDLNGPENSLQMCHGILLCWQRLDSIQYPPF
jgi:hypothetical protein